MGCGADRELEQRVRRYFSIPVSQNVGTATIRSAILRDLPQGISPMEVYAFLDQRKIGKDGLSSYYRINKQGKIICRVEYNSKTFDFVKKSYIVTFLMLEPGGNLKDVEVREGLAGP